MMQRLIVLLLIIYLSAVVFAPPIPGNDWLRYDDLILLFATIVAVLPRLKERSTKSSSSGHIVMILGFVYLLLLMMLFSSLLAGFSSPYNYFGLVKELLRLGKYILVVVLALSIVDKRHRRIITYWVIALAILVVVTQLAQYLGDIRFNQMFAQFYGELHHFGAALAPRSRERGFFYAGGPFANPNVASSFLIMPLILTLFLVFSGFVNRQDEKQSSLKKRALLIAITFMLFVGILLTDSRAAMVALLIAGLFFLLVSQSSKGCIVSLVVVIMPLTVILLFAPTLMNKALFTDHVIEGLTVGSFSVKMAAFQNGVSQLSDSGFWWGFGADSGPHVDFEVAHIVMWYGLPGIIVFSLFWFGMMWGVLRHKEAFNEWPAIFAIIMTSIIMNLSQSMYLNNRVFPVFIVIVLMNFTVELLERDKKSTQISALPVSQSPLS